MPSCFTQPCVFPLFINFFLTFWPNQIGQDVAVSTKFSRWEKYWNTASSADNSYYVLHWLFRLFYDSTNRTEIDQIQTYRNILLYDNIDLCQGRFSYIFHPCDRLGYGVIKKLISQEHGIQILNILDCDIFFADECEEYCKGCQSTSENCFSLIIDTKNSFSISDADKISV